MTPERFATTRQPLWRELEAMLVRVRGGRVRGIATSEIERLGVLYRHAASDLAIARRDFPDENVTVYLNSLCARTHPLMVRGEPARLSALPRFYAVDVPRIFRASWRYMLLSLAITLLGAGMGALAYLMRPDLRVALAGTSLFDLLAKHQIQDIPDPIAGSWTIILNNIFVTMACVAGGFALGIPTILALVQNGFMLGVMAVAVHMGGYDAAFWTDIAPHGIVEISVIVFAGGAGLMIARAVWTPGQRPRRQLVPEVAFRAGTFTVAVAALLLICGTIEGFVSPSGLAPEVKVLIGLIYATIVYSWLLIGGRSRSRSRPAAVKDRSAEALRPAQPAVVG